MMSELVADLVDVVVGFVPWTIFLVLIIKIRKSGQKTKFFIPISILFVIFNISILYKVNTIEFYTLNPITITTNCLFSAGFFIFGFVEFNKLKKIELEEKKYRIQIVANSFISFLITIMIIFYMALVFTGFIGFQWKENKGSYLAMRDNDLIISVLPLETNDIELSDFEGAFLEKGAEISVHKIDDEVDIALLEKSIKNFKAQKKQYKTYKSFLLSFIIDKDFEIEVNYFILDNSNQDEIKIRDNSYVKALIDNNKF